MTIACYGKGCLKGPHFSSVALDNVGPTWGNYSCQLLVKQPSISHSKHLMPRVRTKDQYGKM